MKEAGKPDDPSHYDHPLTMLYLDGDRLYLTHYCDAGNRPRMVAKASPDGKTLEFDFVDVAGGTEHGHMHHATFTLMTRTITLKTGLTWRPATSRFTRTSICSAQNNGTYL